MLIPVSFLTRKEKCFINSKTEATKIPFIVKGVLTPAAAEKCAKAGCYGIVVSNHGGRIMADSAVPASMLQEIKKIIKAYEDVQIKMADPEIYDFLEE